MTIVSVRDAKAGFSDLVDAAIKGDVVTITRHGKPVAALVSAEAAEVARRALGKSQPSLLAYLRTYPGGDFERNSSTSRDVDL